MTRISVYQSDGYETKLAGWFDPDSAEAIQQGTHFDGNNMVGNITGSEFVSETLYRTAGGRWVRHSDARRYYNGPESYEFIGDDQAREWLIRSECNEDALARHFADTPDEAGPGRPEIGPRVPTRFPDELLARVDAAATDAGVKRAEMIRRLVEAGLAGQPQNAYRLP